MQLPELNAILHMEWLGQVQSFGYAYALGDLLSLSRKRETESCASVEGYESGNNKYKFSRFYIYWWPAIYPKEEVYNYSCPPSLHSLPLLSSSLCSLRVKEDPEKATENIISVLWHWFWDFPENTDKISVSVISSLLIKSTHSPVYTKVLKLSIVYECSKIIDWNCSTQ